MSPRPLLAAAVLAFALGVVLVLAGYPLAAPRAKRSPPRVPDLEAVGRAVVIPMDELPDAAIAVFDTPTSRIYLNTRLLSQIGPSLAAFLRAHEEGHVAYHHAPERRFGLVRMETPAPVLHLYEFAADCYAGQALRRGRPDAVVAAIRFFQQRRNLVTDSAHPSMGARADRLIDCLTDPRRSSRYVYR
jgi:Zn-dependent protease with chaperone function